MSTNQGFALGKEDVACVLESAGLPIEFHGGSFTLNGSSRLFESACETVSREEERIARAALEADGDIELQTDAALSEIRVVLREAGIVASVS